MDKNYPLDALHLHVERAKTLPFYWLLSSDALTFEPNYALPMPFRRKALVCVKWRAIGRVATLALFFLVLVAELTT